MPEKIKELYNKYREIINYLIVGVLTTVVSLGVYYGLRFTILSSAEDYEIVSIMTALKDKDVQVEIATVISWIAAVLFAYYANRKYVFFSSDKNIALEMARFFGGRVGTLLMELGWMALTVSLLSWNDKLMKLAAQVIVTIGNYVISKLLVFRKK